MIMDVPFLSLLAYGSAQVTFSRANADEIVSYRYSISSTQRGWPTDGIDVQVLSELANLVRSRQTCRIEYTATDFSGDPLAVRDALIRLQSVSLFLDGYACRRGDRHVGQFGTGLGIVSWCNVGLSSGFAVINDAVGALWMSGAAPFRENEPIEAWEHLRDPDDSPIDRWWDQLSEEDHLMATAAADQALAASQANGSSKKLAELREAMILTYLKRRATDHFLPRSGR